MAVKRTTRERPADDGAVEIVTGATKDDTAVTLNRRHNAAVNDAVAALGGGVPERDGWTPGEPMPRERRTVIRRD